MTIRYRDGVSLHTGLVAIGRALVFRGRSTRREVVSALILIVAAELLWRLLANFLQPPIALGVATLWHRLAIEQTVGLVLLLPLPALIARRLHDIGLPALPGLAIATIALIGFVMRKQAIAGLHPGVPLLGNVAPFAMVALAILLFWSPQMGDNRHGADPRSTPQGD